MGLGWVFLVRGDTGSYRIIDWIVLYCWMNPIALLAGSYLIGWIGSYRIGWIRKHWILCAALLLDGWYGWDVWDGWDRWGVSGAGVGRTDVSTRWNGSATMGARTGAPPLDLEGRRAMGNGEWDKLRRCCKDAEYFFRKSKIIKIECTRIRTNT